MKTPEQIIEQMVDEMPFSIPEGSVPYIIEAMSIYSKQVAKQALQNAANELNLEWRNSIDSSYAPAHILATITNEENIPS